MTNTAIDTVSDDALRERIEQVQRGELNKMRIRMHPFGLFDSRDMLQIAQFVRDTLLAAERTPRIEVTEEDVVAICTAKGQAYSSFHVEHILRLFADRKNEDA